MGGAEEVRALIGDYLAQARQAERESSPWDRLLGTGEGGAAKAPCHGQFAQALEAWLGDFARENPASGQVREVLACLYRAPLDHQDCPSAHWMLLAVHGLTLGLTGRLAPEDAAALWEAYRKNYPRRTRMPVQNQVLAALDAAGGAEKKSAP